MRLARPSRTTVLAGLLLSLAVGCGFPPPPSRHRESGGGREPSEGPGGRQQPLALSPERELAVGRRAYAEVMQEYGKRALPVSAPEVVRVRRIVARLAKAAAIEPLQREILLRFKGYRFEWEANVVRDDQINAFCLPAGKIVVFTGILKVTGDDDDFLATVLSHEMAHALAHHASERVARSQSRQNVLRSLSYDRMQEAEADHIGVFLMPFAGYDPRKAVAFWTRMSQVHGAGGRKPEFLSDHPSDENRIRALRQEVPMAIRARSAYHPKREAPADGGR